MWSQAVRVATVLLLVTAPGARLAATVNVQQNQDALVRAVLKIISVMWVKSVVMMCVQTHRAVTVIKTLIARLRKSAVMDLAQKKAIAQQAATIIRLF